MVGPSPSCSRHQYPSSQLPAVMDLCEARRDLCGSGRQRRFVRRRLFASGQSMDQFGNFFKPSRLVFVETQWTATFDHHMCCFGHSPLSIWITLEKSHSSCFRRTDRPCLFSQSLFLQVPMPQEARIFLASAKGTNICSCKAIRHGNLRNIHHDSFFFLWHAVLRWSCMHCGMNE